MILEGTVNEPATVSVGGQPAQVWGIGNGQYAFRGSAPVASGANSVPIVARDASYTGANATNIAEHQTTRNAQVQASGVAIPSLAYDNNGNLIRETLANLSQRLFEWDAANRLVKVIDSDTATTTTWSYNGRGQRVQESVNGVVTTKWQWDGLQMRVMIAGTTLRRYYANGMQWTPNTGQPATTSNYYFFRDHLGSLREMIDTSGNLHKRYAYDLWGRRTQTANTTTVPEPMIGFTGHFYHAATRFHLAFYRAYSAELGRWLSRDPISENGGINLYGYVKNDSTQRIDVLGLNSCNCIQDAKNGWKGVRLDWPNWNWSETLFEYVSRLERENMTHDHSDYGGAFAHCVFHCMYKRFYGCNASKVAVFLHNEIFENPNGIFGDFSDSSSPTDIIANQAGANAADGPGSCVDECKKVYPPLPK